MKSAVYKIGTPSSIYGFDQTPTYVLADTDKKALSLASEFRYEVRNIKPDSEKLRIIWVEGIPVTADAAGTEVPEFWLLANGEIYDPRTIEQVVGDGYCSLWSDSEHFTPLPNSL